jgi:competence protein ComEC
MSAKATRSAVAGPVYQPLVIVLSAVCGGIVLDRIESLAIAWYWSAASIAWIGWWLLWRAGRRQAAAIALLSSLAGTAAAWHHCQWSLYPSDHVGLFAREVPGPAALEVCVLSGSRRIPAPPPDALRAIATPERTRLDVEVLALRDGESWRPASGVATLFIDGHLLSLEPGDRMRVFAQLNSVGRPHNPGEFDFARQARGDRRLCSLRSEFPECVVQLSHGSPWSWTRVTDWLRSRGDALLWQNLGQQRSGLASAMFLGSREELEPDQAQAFLETGTIHLLVISGLNVGILASCLFLVMRVALVPRSWALAIVALASVLYAATTDSQPPVVRATVMVLIGCLAMVLGRRVLGFNAIAAAGMVVLVLNPAELFHSGTQLSFLSVAVLAWSSQERIGRRQGDALDRLIVATRRWPRRFAGQFGGGLWRGALVSLIIWLVICPLVMARFHLVSPIAIFLGPLLGPPVALAMAAGFGIFALGWMTPAVASFLGWLCDTNLMILESCVRLSRNCRGNHFWVSGPDDWWLAGFYGALACCVIGPRWVPRRRWCLGLLAGPGLLGFGVGAPRCEPVGLHVSLGRPRRGRGCRIAGRQDAALRCGPVGVARCGLAGRVGISLVARHHASGCRRAFACRSRSLQRVARARRAIHCRRHLRIARDVRPSRPCNYGAAHRHRKVWRAVARGVERRPAAQRRRRADRSLASSAARRPGQR